MSSDESDTKRDAEYWRRLETGARTAANTMIDPENKRIMLFIAEGSLPIAPSYAVKKND
jgi:hypothetical protein